MDIEKFKPEVEKYILTTIHKVYDVYDELSSEDYMTYLTQVREMIDREISRTKNSYIDYEC